MYLKWVITVQLKKLEKRLRDILGFTEIRSNTVVETMIENQVSYLTGLLLLFILMKNMEKIQESLLKIRTLKEAAIKSSKRMLQAHKMINSITLMKLINGVDFMLRTNNLTD